MTFGICAHTQQTNKKDIKGVFHQFNIKLTNFWDVGILGLFSS